MRQDLGDYADVMPPEEVHRRCFEGIGGWSTDEATTNNWYLLHFLCTNSLLPMVAAQVQLSRFFAWPCHWRRFAPFYSFMGKVHQFRATQAGVPGHGEEDQDPGGEVAEAEEGAPVSQAAAAASRTNRKAVQEDILTRLRDLQKKKPTLEVVRTILEDKRVKIYANMPLDNASSDVWGSASFVCQPVLLVFPDMCET